MSLFRLAKLDLLKVASVLRKMLLTEALTSPWDMWCLALCLPAAAWALAACSRDWAGSEEMLGEGDGAADTLPQVWPAMATEVHEAVPP